MAAKIQPYPKFQALDSNGNPRVGAKLFTYEPGTTTKKTTYTDSTKASANTNPIILDSNGEASVWCDGKYKFVLAPAIDTDPPASPIWTLDHVGESDAATDAQSYGRIFNGSFEIDDNGDGEPDNWTITDGTNHSHSLAGSADSDHGDVCLRIDMNDITQTTSAQTDTFNVSPGERLIVRLRHKASTTDVGIELLFEASVGGFILSGPIADNGGVTSTSWQDLVGVFDVPASATDCSIIIRVSQGSAGACSVFLDHVRVESGAFLETAHDVTATWSFTGVDINGGTIDGTTIGATTPANGTFLDLVADKIVMDEGYLAAVSEVLTASAVVDACFIDTTKDTNPDWTAKTAYLSYGLEARPSGKFLGRYANEAAARAAGGTTNDWYARTGSTTFYSLDSGSGETQIYRAGSAKFPKFALAVVESDKVVIYDLSTRIPSMWMVGVTGGYALGASPLKAIAYKEGVLCVANSGGGLRIFNFGEDRIDAVTATAYYQGAPIADRLTFAYWFSVNNARAIVNSTVNDVAITVLPTAPLNAFGLKEPTIAVATAGNVSVIKDDGNVWDITDGTYANCSKVFFDGNILGVIRDSSLKWAEFGPMPTADIAASSWRYGALYHDYNPNTPALLSTTEAVSALNKDAVGSALGLIPLKLNNAAYKDSLFARVTKAYNTGWMHGNIRGALLADSVVGGLVGSELITNGAFTSDLSGWTTFANGSASVTWVGGAARLVRVSFPDNYCYIEQAIATTVGKRYVIKFKTTAIAGTPHLRVYHDDPSYIRDFVSPGDHTVEFTATGASHTIRFYPLSAATIDLDNVSIYEVTDDALVGGNLIPNGTFDASNTWTLDTDWSITGGQLVGNSTSTGSARWATADAITTVIGTTYTLSFEIVSKSGVAGNEVRFLINGAQVDIGDYAVGRHSYTFTAVSTSTQLLFGFTTTADVADAITFDNVTITVAVEDRSVKAKGAQVFGTITRSLVHADSDIVAYSGFSAANYIQQPYNINLDFGTNDWYFSWWFKQNANSASEAHFERSFYSGSYSGAAILARTEAAGQLRFFISDDGFATYDDATTSATYDDGQWHKAELVRSGSNFYLYIDDVLVLTDTATAAAGSLSNTSATLKIGDRNQGSEPATNLALALFRVSSTVPTAEQRKFMYETERVIFQGNPCLLDGDSDAITALDYDDVTDLLHVGTSWGRSAFSNLIRVDSSATAVGAITALAAHGGMGVDGGASGSRIAIPELNLREDALAELVQDDDNADEGWKDLTLQSSWVAFDADRPAQYRKVNDIVYLRGLIKSGTTTGGTLLFTLPVGCRPKHTKYFAVPANLAFCSLYVGADGTLRIGTGASATWTELNNIAFEVEK